MSRGSDSHAMSAMAGSKETGHSQTGSNAMVGSALRLVMGVMSVKKVYVIGGLGLSTSGGMPSARVQSGWVGQYHMCVVPTVVVDVAEWMGEMLTNSDHRVR